MELPFQNPAAMLLLLLASEQQHLRAGMDLNALVK